MLKGKFLVIDSGEGAGKTSQLNKAKEVFGDRLVITREPGGSPYAEEIRNILHNSKNANQADAKTFFALFWASRADHLKNIIIPALKNGKIVISDRFDSSTYAYQIVAQGSRDLQDLFWKIRKIYLGDVKPDLYIYFDIDPKIGLSRKNKQGVDELHRFEMEKISFHNKIRVGFKEFLEKVPHKIVDASKSIDEVWNDFHEILKKYV